MDRSVAQGRRTDPPSDPATDAPDDSGIARWQAILVGCLLALAALVIYLATSVDRAYDHFVWQAAAFLEGSAAIRYPVAAAGGLPGNAFFQDVLPIATSDGIARALLPFPPLPAVALLPFVAVWGLATNDQVIFTVMAAIDIAICWWAIGRLPVGLVVRLATTIFFAFGTVFWFTAQVATTWYQAHIVAVGLTFLAIGLALGADPDPAAEAISAGVQRPGGSADPDDGPAPAAPAPARTPTGGRAGPFAIDRRQFMAGLLFGLACTARLSIVFGAPFFAFVGGGSGWRGRAWSAGLGAALPLVGLLAYDVVTTGQLISPAYDHLYRLETAGYAALGYHADWGIEDVRYLFQNLGVALLGTPDLLPAHLPDALGRSPVLVCTDPTAVRGLFDVDCPLAVPRDTGMSVLLTSPAYLLAIPVLGHIGRNRLVAGAVLAVVAIATFNVLHFSQGWVQFGYRFSNDAAPFALVLVALGFERLAVRRRWGMLLAMGLVVASLSINLWGVIWSRSLGW